jgi:hypothetical protein
MPPMSAEATGPQATATEAVAAEATGSGAASARLRWLALGLLTLAIAEILGVVLILAAAEGGATGGLDAFVLGFLASVATNTTIGAVVVARLPGQYAGWTLLAGGLSFGLALLAAAYGLLGSPTGHSCRQLPRR